MKKIIIIIIVILLLLVGGYFAFFRKTADSAGGIPTGTKAELDAKIQALEYQLTQARKAGKDTTDLEKQIAAYQVASAKSSFSGQVYLK